MDIENFDWNFYIENNLDLIENNINTKESAINHWINFGQYEDRISKFKNSINNQENNDNKLSNLCEHIDKLKNLQENNSITKEDAWNILLSTYEKSSNIITEVPHINDNILEDFVTITIENFDWDFYLINNNDLVKNDINNKVLCWDHWIIFGKNENRDFKLLTDQLTTPVNDLNNCVIVNEDNFDWKFYLKSNDDLVKNNIITKERAWHHWLTIGKTENRIVRIINNKLTIENSTNSDLQKNQDEQKTVLSKEDTKNNLINDLIDFDLIYHNTHDEYILPEVNKIIPNVYRIEEYNNIQNKTSSILQKNITSNIIDEKISNLVNDESSDVEEQNSNVVNDTRSTDPFSDIVNDLSSTLVEDEVSNIVEDKVFILAEDNDSTVEEEKVSTLVEEKVSTLEEENVSKLEDKVSILVEDENSTIVEDQVSKLEDKVSTIVEDENSTIVEDQVSTIVEDQVYTVDNTSTESKSIELLDNTFVKIKFDKEFILSLSDKKNYTLTNFNESI